METVNEVGNRYGRLTVVARAKNNNYGQACWLCQCDCDGKQIRVLGYSLRQKNTASCGCLRSEMVAEKNFDNRKHGAKSTPEYAAYVSAKGRCNNPRNRSYKDYGGSGCPKLVPDRHPNTLTTALKMTATTNRAMYSGRPKNTKLTIAARTTKLC